MFTTVSGVVLYNTGGPALAVIMFGVRLYGPNEMTLWAEFGQSLTPTSILKEKYQL